jgi:hypothetical protein
MSANFDGAIDGGKGRRGQRTLLTWSLALTIGGLGTCQFHRALFSSGSDSLPGDRGVARSFVYLAEQLVPGCFGASRSSFAPDVLSG